MLRIDSKFGRWSSLFLATLPFLICIAAYIWIAHSRHEENPSDKIVPTISQMADSFSRTFMEADRKGDKPLIVDTWASAQRFFISIAIIFVGGVFLGLNMGIFPFVEKLLHRFTVFFDKIPALALLPILFILFGLEEESKIALIVIGVMPTIILDTYNQAKAIPKEQIVKGLTLGASHQEIAYRIVLPQIFPNVLNSIRLNLKAAMLFLIAGESLAATVGLGYRIFVVRRYMAMDIIIPYVLWMSLLLFAADFLLRFWINKRYPWLTK